MFTYNLQSLHYYFGRILAYLLGRETEQLLLIIYVVISFCSEPRLTGNQLVLLIAKTCLLTLKKLKRSHIKRSSKSVYINYNNLLVLYAYLSIVSACICIILLFNNLIKILLK